MFWLDIKDRGRPGSGGLIRVHFLRYPWGLACVLPFSSQRCLFCQVMRWHTCPYNFHPLFHLSQLLILWCLPRWSNVWESPSRRFPKHIGQASQNTPCLLKAHSSVSSDVFATFANSLRFTVVVISKNKHITKTHNSYHDPLICVCVICAICKVCRFCTLLMLDGQFW